MYIVVENSKRGEKRGGKRELNYTKFTRDFTLPTFLLLFVSHSWESTYYIPNVYDYLVT